MKLSKYLAPTLESSVLKNVPIENLKELQKEMKIITRVINAYSSVCEIKPVYMFRGPRTHRAHSTLKANAKAASVYLNIKPTCPGISWDTLREMHKHIKQNFAQYVD